jgi:hypothetical protein
MPTWFPSWTKCCNPADYRGMPVGAMVAIGTLGAIMGTIVGLGSISASGASGFLAILSALAPGVAIFLAALCVAAIAFCNWWLYVRLICLGGDRSSIGAIYHLEKPVATANPFDIVDADTDFSFNLLLWQFVPQNSLPQTFVDNQWSPTAFSDLGAEWTSLPPLVPPTVAFSQVSEEVNLIVAQQSMASLGLGFGGQNIEQADKPDPLPANSSSQYFLMHCEIEGPGMHDLLILLSVMAAVLVAAAFVYAIPVVGPILSWIMIALALLAFLIGGPAITHDDASPPSVGGWGGSFNPYETASDPNGLVDLAYVFGRWVYDSLHAGAESNELHPVHYMIKIGCATQGDLTKGIWPPDLGELQQKYDAEFGVINSPTTIEIQKLPENQWTVHPLLDGCLGATPYPDPPPVIV